MGSGWVKHLVGRTLWKVAPCLYELTVMIVTLYQRWRGLSASAVGLGRAYNWPRVVKNCPTSIRSVCELALMVVTLDQTLTRIGGWLGWVMHLVGQTLWKVAPCLCESAIMVVTCRLDTDKDRRVVGLRGGRVESSV